MGLTRTSAFTEEQNTTAILLKALGHPARIAIIEFLLEVDSAICGDIVNRLPLAQATISQHLKELRVSGLITGNVEGSAMRYRIDKKTMANVKEIVDGIYKKVNLQDLRSLYRSVR